jgi:hypothetical protein
MRGLYISRRNLQAFLSYSFREGDCIMMKAETLLPMDLELNILNENTTRTRNERIWLTADQYEVLEIVARILGQTVSEYITETILSMLECELEDNISDKLSKKLNLHAGKKEAEQL